MYSDDMEIKNLYLTGHLVQALKRAGIYTIGQLKELSDVELLEIKGVGMKSFEEINRIVPDRIRERENERVSRTKPRLTPEDAISMGVLNDDMNLNELYLSPRTLKALERSKICTVGKLRQYTDDELLSLRSVGAKVIEEIDKFIPDRIKERNDEEQTEPITAEGIISMLENGMTMVDICTHYNRGKSNIERILCEHCNSFPESVDRLIAVLEKQFEKTDAFYGMLKEERRSEQYHKAMGLPFVNE